MKLTRRGLLQKITTSKVPFAKILTTIIYYAPKEYVEERILTSTILVEHYSNKQTTQKRNCGLYDSLIICS